MHPTGISRAPLAVASFVSWHRRGFGALLAALAVLLLAEALTTPPPTVVVVALQRGAAAGEPLTRAHLTTRGLPTAAVPEGALASIDEAVGETLAVSAGAGTVLQRAFLARATAAAPGRAVVPIVVADDDLRRLVSPGDLVSLVSAVGEAPELVTGDARVVALPHGAEEAALRVPSAAGRGALLVDVPAPSAPLVALLGQAGQLALILGKTDGG